MQAFTGENGKIITPDKIERWAQQAEKGHYPGRRGEISVGRPPLTDEELAVVTFKCPPSVVAQMDKRAKTQGISRSSFLRNAIAHELDTTAQA